MTRTVAKKEEKTVMERKRYQLLISMCLVLHTLFLIIFGMMGVKSLFYFNIVSVLLYLTGTLKIQRQSLAGIWLYIYCLEILSHVALCNLRLGWGYGFSFYGILVVPVIYYTTYTQEDIRHNLLVSNIVSVLCAIIVVATSLLCHGVNRLGMVSVETVKYFFIGNGLICIFTLALYSRYFVLEMQSSTQALQDYNDELYFLANYDALTHLRNRRNMKEIFSEYEAHQDEYCVALADIDDFKKVNDTYSHSCGDAVLVHIADMITKEIGDAGIVCRWGGEEILFLLHCERQQGEQLIEQVRCAIQDCPLNYEEKEIRVTMTFGFASSTEERNVERMISIADARLYVGKANGKNQVVSHS